MACNTFGTVSVDCLEEIGGIETAYVMRNANLDTSQGTNGYDTDTTTGNTITSIYLTSSSSTDLFQEIQTVDTSSNWGETRNFELANGTQGYETLLTYIVPLSDSTTRKVLNEMMKNKCIVIVKNVDGRYFLLGKRNGGYWTSGSYNSGSAISDRNGFEIMFSSFETDLAYEVSSSIVAALINEA